MGALSARVLPALGLVLGAPLIASPLQPGPAGGTPFLALALILPVVVYGGGALLLREVAVRSRRGWPGIALCCLAGGLALTMALGPPLGGGDALFLGVARTGEADSAAAITAWLITLHVVLHGALGLAVPLALLDGLVPRIRGRTLLNAPMLGAMTALMLVAVVVAAGVLAARGVAGDGTPLGAMSGSALGAGLLRWVVVVVVVLLAVSRIGRTLPRRRPVPNPAPRLLPRWVALLLGAVPLVVLGHVPLSWPGVLLEWLVLVLVVVLICLSVRAGRWPVGAGVSVAIGAVLASVITSLPTLTAGTASGLGLVRGVAVVLLLGVAWWRSRPGSRTSPAPGSGALSGQAP